MNKKKNLSTEAQNTWCPGCGNFAILNTLKSVITSLVEDENIPYEDIVIVSGIGCHGKLVDYIDVNSFYSLHGRSTPPAEGIKIANPKLKVISIAGDGDAYGEGMAHLIFGAKKNIDITTIVHDNRVYGLTTGQYTPTSPEGYRGRSTPYGCHEWPINPMEVMLSSGATYLARGFSNDMDLLKKLFKEAILHKGFALVDVLQVCSTFYNLYQFYNEKVYHLDNHDASDYEEAHRLVRQWDYSNTKDVSIALGTFYRAEKPVFEESFEEKVALDRADRENEIKKCLSKK
ncbi:MAG: thiamine pyrophosphate-dependent enzyme [Chlamydiota bacterium]